ncbi:MAG: zinc-ribbon domain-containing protein [Polyangia bacterium]
MHIRCERCRAEYDLDDGQVRGGTDVQCSVCGSVFAVGARRTPTSLTRRRSSPQAMAVSVPNDDYRGSDVHFPTVDGETARAGWDERTHGALKIFVGLTVAAGVAFAGIEWQQGRIHSAAIARNSAGRTDWTEHPAARAPEAKPDVGAGAAAAQAPNERPTPVPASKGPVVEALPSPAHVQAEAAVERTAPPKRAVAPVESYEKLIASGERALENGADSKAKDLYQKALKMRPAGADALAGLAFVALDRGQIPAAYELFKRALTAKASFGPALFGMAEIHRARGEKALALQSYQRYLQVSPNGKEASAARRQVGALQSGR